MLFGGRCRSHAGADERLERIEVFRCESIGIFRPHGAAPSGTAAPSGRLRCCTGLAWGSGWASAGGMFAAPQPSSKASIECDSKRCGVAQAAPRPLIGSTAGVAGVIGIRSIRRA